MLLKRFLKREVGRRGNQTRHIVAIMYTFTAVDMHTERERLTSSHSVSCNTSVTTLFSKCGNFNSTAYTRDMDAIRDADTPIFDESAEEGTEGKRVAIRVKVTTSTSPHIAQQNEMNTL